MTSGISASPKILIIFAHPDPENSIANKVLIDAAISLPNVTVHDLYASYPDFFIDVIYEHELLTAHDIIVFQHPLYMYSCPSLLKEWIDCVLGKGFAYGDGKAMVGKYWRSVVTTGGAKQAFTPEGYNRYTMNDFLRPFEITAYLCQMHWLEPKVIYWSRNISKIERLQQADEYQRWLQNPLQCEVVINYDI